MAFNTNEWANNKYKKYHLVLDKKKDKELIEKIEKFGGSATEYVRKISK